MEPVPARPGDPEASDERSLLDALKRGEEPAFHTLVTTYGPRLRATALRILQNDADANDAVQDAFLAAVRGVARFKGQSRLSTWLHRIVVNAALMKIRSRARKPETDIHDLLPRFDDGGTHLEPAMVIRDLPDEQSARTETATLVRSCIGRLPLNYRTALILKDIEELDYGEISMMLGLTLNATRIRIHRARQALRKLLIPHLGVASS